MIEKFSALFPIENIYIPLISSYNLDSPLFQRKSDIREKHFQTKTVCIFLQRKQLEHLGKQQLILRDNIYIQFQYFMLSNFPSLFKRKIVLVKTFIKILFETKKRKMKNGWFSAIIVVSMTEVHNDRKSIRIIGVYPEITGKGRKYRYQNINCKCRQNKTSGGLWWWQQQIQN